MKKKVILFLLAVIVSILFLTCEAFQNPGLTPQVKTELEESGTRATISIPKNFGCYKITKPGTYIIKGTVTGQCIDIKSANVTLRGDGANAVFKGKKYSGKRSLSHIRGGGSNLVIKNFTFQGKVGHNFMSLSGNGNKIIDNLKVYNATKAGAGAINPGPNSMVKNCYINPHDDAIKITEKNSRAQNNVLVMDGNGSAIQLGWGKRSDGPVHYAFNTKISGYLRHNKQTDQDNNPGRAIIGGIFENNVSDIKITGLNINMNSKHNAHYVKLRANGGSVSKVLIQGVIRNPVKVSSKIHPIALSTGKGGKIQNITIDFNGKIKPSQVFKQGSISGFVLK